MPYLLHIVFIALMLLYTGIALICHAEEVDSDTLLLEKSLNRLDTVMESIKTDTTALEGEISTLKTQEEDLRAALKTDLNTFYNATGRIVQMERIPKEAMAMQGALTLSHRRAKLLEKGQTDLQARLKRATEAIHDLLRIRGQMHQKQEHLTAMQHDAARVRTATQTLLAEKANLVTLSAAKKKRLWQDVNNVARANDLSRFFAHRAEKSLGEKNAETALPEGIVLPVTGRVVRAFKEADQLGLHPEGVDIRTVSGAEVRAMANGKVVYSDTFGSYDHVVIIAHDGNLHSVYGNLKTLDVKVGDVVSANGIIGRLPQVKSPELYLELRRDGKTIDPVAWLGQKRTPSS